MDDLKQLSKLIKLCTKYSLKSFKNEQVELVFSEEIQAQNASRQYTKGSKAKLDVGNEDFKTDAPSQDSLLFWSSTGSDFEDMEGNND